MLSTKNVIKYIAQIREHKMLDDIVNLQKVVNNNTKLLNELELGLEELLNLTPEEKVTRYNENNWYINPAQIANVVYFGGHAVDRETLAEHLKIISSSHARGTKLNKYIIDHLVQKIESFGPQEKNIQVIADKWIDEAVNKLRMDIKGLYEQIVSKVKELDTLEDMLSRHYEELEMHLKV